MSPSSNQTNTHQSMEDRRDTEDILVNDTYGIAATSSGRPTEPTTMATGGSQSKKKDLWSAAQQSETMKPKRDLWSAAKQSEIMRSTRSAELADTEGSDVADADPARGRGPPVTESITTKRALPARYRPRRSPASSNSTVPTDGGILVSSTQPSETKVGNTGSGSTATPKRYRRRQNTSNQA